MNTTLSFLSLRLFFALAPVLAGIALSAPELRAEEQLYTCGMHPQVIRKAPGDCPICGMKLTPVRANTAGETPATATAGERKIKFYKSTMLPGQISDKPAKDTMGMDMVPVYEGEDASSSSAIKIDPVMIQRMNLKTEVVARGPVRRQIRAVGTVGFNESGLRDISLKYEGWVEKLHVTETGSAVKAGDPLFEIYSPELYNAQLNYLVALRAEGETGGPLTRASLERLKLFEVSQDFITALAKAGVANRTYTYHAPVAGIVTEKMAVEGRMMKPGEVIFRLADLSSVWVHAQVYEKDFAAVTPGMPAEVRSTYATERVFAGRVVRVLPMLETMTRTATARIVIANPDGLLRPGMFTEVRLESKSPADAVLVPDSAVLRSGERNTVFIALDGGAFEPREVTLGARTDDYRYAVLKGISVGDRVVISGQFMLDSESRLREAIGKMLREEKPAESATENDSTVERKNPETMPKDTAASGPGPDASTEASPSEPHEHCEHCKK